MDAKRTVCHFQELLSECDLTAGFSSNRNLLYLLHTGTRNKVDMEQQCLGHW